MYYLSGFSFLDFWSSFYYFELPGASISERDSHISNKLCQKAAKQEQALRPREKPRPLRGYIRSFTLFYIVGLRLPFSKAP